MKILQLCKKFPYPLKDGESIAVTYLSKALFELGCEITLLAMNTSKHYLPLEELPEHYNHYKKIETVYIYNHLNPWDAFKNLFSKESYHITRFISKDFEKKLIALLQQEQYDVIQLETIYLAPYIPVIRKYSSSIISMRAHNIEHEIWERYADNISFLPKKWYMKYLNKKLKRYEMEQLNNYDMLVAITERDLKKFIEMGERKKAVSSPIGLDIRDYMANDSCFEGNLTAGFIGSLDWMPNQEGLVWFLDEVWDALSAKYPEIELHIAGRNTPWWIAKRRSQKVIIHGEIPDAVSFINQHPIMIVPLFSGSGMRVKILEGMALGKVVITTSLGLEGINASHLEEVIVADTPEEFIACFEYCANHRQEMLDIGRKAQVFVAKNYDNRSIAKDLMTAYRELGSHQVNGSKVKIVKESLIKKNNTLL